MEIEGFYKRVGEFEFKVEEEEEGEEDKPR